MQYYNKQKKILFLPLKVILLYLVITLLMYFLSPFEWSYSNCGILLIFNIFIYVSIIWGYNLGIKRPQKKYKIKFIKLNKYFTYSLIFAIILLYPKYLNFLHVQSLSISVIFQRFFIAITNLGDAYSLRLDDYLASPTNWINYITFFLFPVQYLIKTTAIFFWNELSKVQKFLILIYVSLDIFLYYIVGTNKGIFDYIILLIFILIFNNKDTFNQNIRKFIFDKRIVTFIVIFVTAISFFTMSFGSRTGSDSRNINLEGINKNNVVYKFVPKSLRLSYLGLTSYLSQGYNALDLSFNLNWEPCFGLGYSRYLYGITNKYFEDNDYIKKRTYEYRIDSKYNWNMDVKWHTAFVPFANDVSLYGVPIIIFIFSYYLGFIWRDSLYSRDVISTSILSLLLILFMYLNANNQIFAYESEANAFFFLVIIQIFSKTKYIIKQNENLIDR